MNQPACPCGCGLAIRLRRDGITPKAFWYDPDAPGHIVHHTVEGYVKLICVGHGDR